MVCWLCDSEIALELGGALSGLLGIGGVLLYLALFLVTLAGYYEGMELWLGWGFLPAFLVMMVCFVFRDIGGLFITVVAFFGMWKGFDWEWWQAGLVAFPMVGLMLVFMIGGGILSALRSVFSRG